MHTAAFINLVVVRRCLEACLLMETDILTEIRLRAFRQGEQHSGELNSEWEIFIFNELR